VRCVLIFTDTPYFFLKDSANCNGGKWIIRFKKVVSGRFWEDLVSANIFICDILYLDKISGMIVENNKTFNLLSDYLNLYLH